MMGKGLYLAVRSGMSLGATGTGAAFPIAVAVDATVSVIAAASASMRDSQQHLLVCSHFVQTGITLENTHAHTYMHGNVNIDRMNAQ